MTYMGFSLSSTDYAGQAIYSPQSCAPALVPTLDGSFLVESVRPGKKTKIVFWAVTGVLGAVFTYQLFQAYAVIGLWTGLPAEHAAASTRQVSVPSRGHIAPRILDDRSIDKSARLQPVMQH